MHFLIAIALIWRETKSGREILVARRNEDAEHLPGMMEFPGGKCQENESPRDCAIREAREEIGIKIEIIAARAVIEHEYSLRRVMIYPFDAIAIAGEPRSIECAKVFWISPHELKAENFPPANVELIAALQKQAR